MITWEYIDYNAGVDAPQQMTIYGFLFVSAYLLVRLFTPLTAKLARKLGALDYPGYRKIHDAPVPRLGGLAVFAAASVSILLGCALNRYIRADIYSLRGMFVGGLIILLLGIVDDVRNLSPFLKLPVQFIAACVAVLLGIKFHLASNPLADNIRDFFDLGSLGIPLTILWIVGLTNAMNLVDGLDGLATGISMFASTALFIISIRQGAGIATYMYATIAGATLSFLRYNHFPAKMFLGDTGSTSLGFAFACLSVQGTHKSYTLAALFIPVIVFGLPIFDAIVTLIRRHLSHARFLQGDKLHIHHLLLSSGLSQRQAVTLLYGVTIILGILGFTFTYLLDEYAAVILLLIGFLAGVLAKELNVFGTPKLAEEKQSPDANKQQDT
jgi:UDP-GlcNAc:undecaprenyl-phosphate GlcNAc-1-phosphate transferase